MPRQSGQRTDAHARIYGKWRNLPAWVTLSPLEISILVEAIRDCGLHPEDVPSQNVIRLTATQMRKRWKCSHKTASKALVNLQDKGWIERVALAPGRTGQAGGLYELMMLDAARKPKEGPYRKWRPDV